jgi:hypothetical protein
MLLRHACIVAVSQRGGECLDGRAEVLFCHQPGIALRRLGSDWVWRVRRDLGTAARPGPTVMTLRDDVPALRGGQHRSGGKRSPVPQSLSAQTDRVNLSDSSLATLEERCACPDG